MRLSEIAENIVKYHPDCCMAKNYEIINGCREDWYEESLIEPLMSYWMYEDLDLCGCGRPEYTYEVIRKFLYIRQDWRENKLEYTEVLNRYKRDLHVDGNDNNQFGLLQFMMYILDEHEFIEHGSSITGCWLTEKGEMLLVTLDAWHNENMKTEADQMLVP